MQAGCQNKPTVFLFDETQIVQETFLEDINNILTSGTNPCLSAPSIVADSVPPVNLSAPGVLHQSAAKCTKLQLTFNIPAAGYSSSGSRDFVSQGGMLIVLMPCGDDTGEVPNLFPKDELAGVLDEVRADAKKQGAGETGDALYAFFLERVRTNLHVILCLSPIGEAFRERCRMFPGMRQDPHHCCQHCNRSCHTIHAQPNATDKVLDRR